MLLKADAASVSIYIEIKSPMLIVRYVLMQCDLVCMLLHLRFVCVCRCVYLALTTDSRCPHPLSLSSLVSISILNLNYIFVVMEFFAMNLFPSRMNACILYSMSSVQFIQTDSFLPYYRCFSCIWFFQYLKVILSRLMNIDGKSFLLLSLSRSLFVFVDNFSSLWILFMEWSEHCINV